MEELLNIERGEYYAATWYTDEELGQIVNVDEEISKQYFERFLEIRSFMQQQQNNIKMGCILMGCALWEIEREKIYRYVSAKKGSAQIRGYSSFYNFCKDVYGLKKRTAARMIAVAKEFCGIDGGIKLEYINYSYSQLSELLGIDEQYRMRIPVTCSVRNIRKLKDLYKTYVPASDKTYEDDLKEWERENKEKKAKKNAKKNAITFIAAEKTSTVPTSAPSKTASAPVEDFDGEDERDVMTPQTKRIPFDSIRAGMYHQLELLRHSFFGDGVQAKWNEFCDLVETALKNRFPDYIVCYSEKQSSPANIVPIGAKLNLKNKESRRAWLDDFRSWGVWIDLPEADKKFYRYNFINGDSLIVEVGFSYYDFSYQKEPYEILRYVIVDKNHRTYDSSGCGGVSNVIDWLTKHAKEI